MSTALRVALQVLVGRLVEKRGIASLREDMKCDAGIGIRAMPGLGNTRLDLAGTEAGTGVTAKFGHTCRPI